MKPTGIAIAAAALACMFVPQALAQPRVFTAVSPLVRTQVPGEARTAIMALINNGDTDATNCRVGPTSSANITYSFFEVSISNNVISNTGTLNAPFDIPAGETRYVALSHSLNFDFGTTGRILRVAQNLVCDNTTTEGFVGLNELNLVQIPGTPADVVSAVVTPSLDGVLRVTTDGTPQRAAGAMINIGSGGNPENVTVRPYFPNMGEFIYGFGNFGGPFEILVCETDPDTGVCLAPPEAQIVTSLGNTARTFAVVLRDNTTYGARLVPDLSRVGLQYFDASGNLVGETNIAYTTPARAPLDPADPDVLTGYAGIYNVSTVSSDGVDWNGSQDLGSGFAVVDTTGEVWLLLYRNADRLSPSFAVTQYNHQFAGHGQLSAGALNGNVQSLSATITGSSAYITNAATEWVPATAQFDGNGAPGGYFYGGVVRTSGDPASPAVTNWPESTNVRANIDAHTIEPVSLADLAGAFSTIQGIADPNATPTESLTLASDGTFSGYFGRTVGEVTESCAISGSIVQPDPALHILRVTLTASANGEADCTFTGSARGVAAYNRPFTTFVQVQGNAQATEVNARSLNVLLQNEQTQEVISITFLKNVG